ncbi:shikimate kinase [Microbacteriaceae bacterium 4G12]
MKAIYITGFMGAGKTTIGKLLSERWGLPVLDTDERVEKTTNRTIRDIFEKEGEKAFRTYETNVLKSLSTNDVIITTGGGIVEKEENRMWMKENGTVLYLYCEPNAIVQRLQGDTTRPLFQAERIEEFLQLFSSREKWYEQAHYTIDTTNKEVTMIVQEIEKLIKK